MTGDRCSMLDVRCWMFDVGCWMFDVGCWMFKVLCYSLKWMEVFQMIVEINLKGFKALTLEMGW
jgi:hypothetical protein